VSGSCDSTTASTKENHHAHFCDGFDTLEFNVGNLIADTNAPLAEWIYIDRDICGFSLFEYSPNNAYFKDFASSDYGRQFVKELKQRCGTDMSSEEYKQEEQQLDEALMLAGVKPCLLHSRK